MSKNYLLSVLVPAYNYPNGIARILAMLPFSESQEFECIVFDNSTSDQISNLANSLCGRHSNFRIRHFVPSTTPVTNWNSLLAAASGKYVMLLHHDEFFASSGDFYRLLSYLRNESPDVTLLNLHKFHIRYGWRHLHLPYFLRAYLLRHHRNYLSRHNFIGPTAALVIKQTHLKQFDHKLKWLVDVAWYLAVVSASRTIGFLPNVCIMTGVDDHATLTKSLDGQISQLIESETAYLSDLTATERSGLLVRIKSWYFRYVDRPLWLLLRALMLPWVLGSLRRYKDPLRT